MAAQSGSQGYLSREVSPPCRNSSAKTSHNNKSIPLSTARSHQDFSVTLWRELFGFLTISKNEILFFKKLAFHTGLNKVHGIQTDFPKLFYYICFPNGELNIFIFTCKTVFTSNWVLIL